MFIVVYNMRVLENFSPQDIFGVGGIKTFWTQNQTRKVDKDFELYQVPMCQTALIFRNIYIYIYICKYLLYIFIIYIYIYFQDRKHNKLIQ